MDASAYLRNQGWRGDGHSLDHTNRGIKKPLLVSKKVDVLGVGLNKHASVSDQWWLRAFDQGLKSLGTGEQTALGQVQRHGVKKGGLYGNFVKGEKIPASIGQSLLPTPEDSETTPIDTSVQVQRDSKVKMGIDIPPEDKLERVVGHHADQMRHDAMMYVLQNPDQAPASMHKMLDRKRKRAERPVEKRARRKTEKTEKMKASKERHRERAMEDGTWNPEKEEEYKRERELNRRANEFVLQAQKQGIIPAGPNEIRRGLIPTGANAEAMQGQPTSEMQQVFNQAGLNSQVKFKGSGKNSLKAQKYEREKLKRQLKRAAKAYLMGEPPPHEVTSEERKAKREKKRLHTAQKRVDAAKKEAETMAKREQRAAEKRARRAEKKVERAEITRIMEEREAAKKAGKTMEEYYAEKAEREAAGANEAAEINGKTSSNEFDSAADEVKFGMNRKGGKKKIPGVGAVERYPTKGEKKAKKLAAMAIKAGISEEEVKARIAAENDAKVAVEREKIDRYRALKHGMDLEEYRKALANKEVTTPWVERKNLPADKLAEYQQRADEKGISLEEYIRRREQKNAAKRSEKLGNPFQQDILDGAETGGEVIDREFEPVEEAAAQQLTNTAATVNGAAAPDELGFVIDTTGDDRLASNPSKKPAADGPTDFSNQVTAAVAERRPLAIVDTTGDETFEWQPNLPVPLDPRIWQGQVVKNLPKAVRRARRDWLKQRREEKKASKLETQQQQGPPKKSKGQRKVEAREAFVKQVLWHSRKALRTGEGSAMVTIEGIQDVPLVKVETTEGLFKKGEVSLARTVARRVLRTVKRQQKAEKGKGKGWKKRERSAKEAARNAGISGFTDKARMDDSGRTPRDLLR